MLPDRQASDVVLRGSCRNVKKLGTQRARVLIRTIHTNFQLSTKLGAYGLGNYYYFGSVYLVNQKISDLVTG